MRIADTTLVELLSSQLQNQQNQIASLDSQLSSGLSIQQPSDNPIGAVEALGYQRQIARATAFENTANAATSWLGLATSSVGSVLNNLQTVKSVVLQALNSGAQTPQSYQAFASQLQGVQKTLLSLANTTYGGTAIFAGTADVPAAYSSSGTYAGNESPFTMQVAHATTVSVSLPGTKIFGGGTTGVQDLFTTLKNIITDLGAGPGATSSANLQTDLGALDANANLVQQAAATLGESSKMVSTAQSVDQSSLNTMQQTLATTVDANVATLGPELQSQMTSYQAAVAAVSQILPLTLSNFVK